MAQIDTALIDMDEVLCDFIGGMCAYRGVKKSTVVSHWQPGEWDMKPALSKSLGMQSPMTDVDFWQKIRWNEGFWTNLKPTEFLKPLIEVVEAQVKNWYIVTSPSMCSTSYSGKVKWLHRQFGNSFNRFVLTNHKHLLARPDSILIDDRDETVMRFIREGGKGIIFPRLHNSLYLKAADPVGYAKEFLYDLVYNSQANP